MGPTFRLSRLTADFIIPHQSNSAPSADISVAKKEGRTIGGRLS